MFCNCESDSQTLWISNKPYQIIRGRFHILRGRDCLYRWPSPPAAREVVGWTGHSRMARLRAAPRSSPRPPFRKCQASHSPKCCKSFWPPSSSFEAFQFAIDHHPDRPCWMRPIPIAVAAMHLPLRPVQLDRGNSLGRGRIQLLQKCVVCCCQTSIM